MRRIIINILMICMIIVCGSATAMAYDAPDLSAKGSITISGYDSDKAAMGGTMTVYKAGDLKAVDGDYSFVPAGDFKACTWTADEIQSPKLAEELADYAYSHSLTGRTEDVGKNGGVVLDGLSTGLYLVVQYDAVPGYELIEPFLVTVPLQQSGQYIYDVDASPKMKLEKTSPGNEPPQPDKPEKHPEPEAVPEPDDGKLMQTGQLNWPVPVLCVTGLILFILGWYINSTSGRMRHEE